MATQTTNLGLTLPIGTERVSRQVVNTNMGLIDSAIGAVPSGNNLQLQISNNAKSISDLNNVFDNITGNEIITLIHGYYINDNVAVGAEVNLTPISGTNRNNYAIVNVTAGEKITINGTGGNAGRLWAFVDSSNLLISIAANAASATDMVLVAPSNATKLILNILDTPGICCRGEYIRKQLEETNVAVDSAIEELSYAPASNNNSSLWQVGGLGSDGAPYERNTSIRTTSYQSCDGIYSIEGTEADTSIFLCLYSANNYTGFIIRATYTGKFRFLMQEEIKNNYPAAKYYKIEIRNTAGAVSEYDRIAIKKARFEKAEIAIAQTNENVYGLAKTVSNNINVESLWEMGGLGSNGETYARNTSIRMRTYRKLENLCVLNGTSEFESGFLCLYSSNYLASFLVRLPIETGFILYNNGDVFNEYPTAKYFKLEIKDVDGDTAEYDQIEIYDFVDAWETLFNYAEIENLISQSKCVVNEGNTLSLLQITDIHGDADAMRFTMSVFNRFSDKLDDILHTGDTVVANYTDGIANWIDTGCAAKVVNVIGNHDTEINLELQAAGKENVYDTFLAPYISGWDVVQPTGVDDSTSNYYKCLFYYKDYDSAKIRLIVLDTNFWDDYEKTWLADVLADAKSEDLSVVLACHSVKKLTEMTDSHFSSITGNGINENHNSYANQPDNWLDPVQSFIDSGGKFVCILSGHNHMGHMGYMTHYPDMFVFVEEKASIGRVTGTARFANESNAYYLSVVTICPSDKLLKIVTIGASVDGIMRGRHVFCYNYETKRIVAQW